MSIAVNNSQTFPALFETARSLVDDYASRGTGDILLALYYQPREPQADLNIFMVIDQFMRNEVWPIDELFEVTYRTSPQMPLPGIDTFHLTITNPSELGTAAKNKWAKLADITDAVREDRFKVLRASDNAASMLDLIKLA